MSSLTKGWCPSLEKPMESGDGLLVRLPIKFGQISSNMARRIAKLSTEYGNGHLDLSARGNLQIRGVTEQNYEALRAELSQLGLIKDFAINIITSPLFWTNPGRGAVTNLLLEALAAQNFPNLPEKFLVVIDSGGWFPISAIPCDLYIDAENANITEVIEKLSTATKCDKKPHGTNLPPLGFMEDGLVLAAKFGRIEAQELNNLADIADKYSANKNICEMVFAPFRRVILPNIKQRAALKEVQAAGFIVESSDPRLNIHACVGAPACSSGLGETRKLAEQYAKDNPKLDKIVHISGCSKGCAYKAVADITITATKSGYETKYKQI